AVRAGLPQQHISLSRATDHLYLVPVRPEELRVRRHDLLDSSDDGRRGVVDECDAHRPHWGLSRGIMQAAVTLRSLRWQNPLAC
ncbi:MAG: hypothetical protein ACJ8KC_05700, partial [Candidatus Udaeobacter sp.]